MIDLFNASRGSAGSRTIQGQMNDMGHEIGRFKVRRLMAEAGLVSGQPVSHRYKRTGQARIDIPNLLHREFNVAGPNEVWCGDISYIWAGDRWCYLAVVIDLYKRRVVGVAIGEKPNAELAKAALDMALKEGGFPKGLMFHSD